LAGDELRSGEESAMISALRFDSSGEEEEDIEGNLLSNSEGLGVASRGGGG
jgi:hypothetical protein